VQNDLGLANDNFDILGQAFIGNDPSSQPVKRAVYIGSTPPSGAVADTLWLDTSVNPPRLKVYNGTSWVNFDTDTVDGFHASQTPQANTIPVAGSTGKLDAGWLPTVGNLNIVEFTSSGNWAVPSGVTKIMVFAIAGGGGGGGSGVGATNGGNGGNTVISGSVSGTILTLTGGGGGGGGSTAPAGPGVSYSGVAGYAIDGTSNNYSGFGAGSPFGGGGRSVKGAGNGETGNGYGSGGSGAGHFGGGGGSGQCVLGAVYSVSSGETLTVTIGAGGSGGGGSYVGGAGKPGFVRIIYFT
jgi:hypothetical protein